MAEKVQFDLVSPERLLRSEAVEMVVVPGTEGDFGVLPGHAPVISTVRPGVLEIFQGGAVADRIFIAGGIAEVSNDRCTVLAGHAPLVTTLRPGILTMYREGGELRVVIDGGFAEVGPSGLTVLADMAVPVEEFDTAVLAGVIKDTEEDAAAATDDWRRDKLSHKIDQLKALQAELQ